MTVTGRYSDSSDSVKPLSLACNFINIATVDFLTGKHLTLPWFDIALQYYSTITTGLTFE